MSSRREPSELTPTAEAAPWIEVSERAARRHADREAAKVYQFALWPEDKRAMPTEFIRSALFGAIHGGAEDYLQRVEIANANDLSIVYTGYRLTQVHADVWEGIMHLARGCCESSTIKFTSRQFLRLIGRPTGKKQRDELKLWFSHLSATCVEVHDKKNQRRFWGSLLPRGADKDDENDTLYVVEINRDLARLFNRGYSIVDWEQRKRLMKKPLCLWLQHHFSAFTKPITVSDLHRLSGSRAKHLRQFRAKLKVALDELCEEGVLTGWRLDEATDSVHVTPFAQGVPRTARAALASHAVAQTLPAQAQLPGLAHPPVSSALVAASVAVISSKAKARFEKLYPEHSADACIADFLAWLTKTERSAEKPDAAFLGFAKRWVDGKSA